ncbi:MAG: phosphate ABC transporter, permease protein PstA, partial [Eubacteriales bacterium]
MVRSIPQKAVPEACNRRKLTQKLRIYQKHPASLVTFLLVCLAALLTVGALLSLIAYVLIRGIPALRPEMFSLEYTSDNQSMLPAIFNTLTVVLVTLLFAVPIGVFSAIYLTEYARRGSKLVKLVRMTTETLSGIPSIVYGLFGAIFFNGVLGWGYSLLSGICTLAIMIL